MTPTEAITALEKALEAGPTPGEWECQDESKFSPDEPYWIGAQHPDVGFVSHAVVRSGCSEADELGDMKANAAFIAACSPLAIRTLLDAHAGALRDAERHKRMADILFSTMQLVRQYPDFDGRDGEENMLGDAMDAAMRGEVHDAVQFIAEIHANYEIQHIPAPITKGVV